VHLQKFASGEVASQELCENPFLPVLADVVSSPQSGVAERELLVELVQSGGKAFSGQSVKSVAASLARVNRPVPAEVGARLATAMNAYREKEEGVLGLADLWKRAAIGRSVVENPQEGREGLESESRLFVGGSLFEPRWIRPAPPRCELEAGELVWIDVDAMTFDVMWDSSMGTEVVSVEEVRELLESAFREPMEPEEQAKLLQRVEDSPKVLEECGLSPARLPELVEHNPAVAIQVLLKLMSSPEISEHLMVLVNMELTPHSMEVVTHLTTAVDMPPEFIHLYITNCIAACKNVADKFNQNRLVRLVSIFLQSLIRNRTIDVLDLQAEVQGFCLEHAKVKEASLLFRMLKNGE
jgi:hypothetical protein